MNLGKQLAAICRRETSLSEMQVSLLVRISAVFPFVADLVHGKLSLYLRSGRDFVIAAEVMPHTVYMPKKKSALGVHIAAQEEPLVSAVFRNGTRQTGKREWTYGAMIDMYAFGIHDGQSVLAVVTFDVDTERLSIHGYRCLLETAIDVLAYARRGVRLEAWHPIAPSDGIIVTDGRSRIIFANEAAQRICRVLGVGNLKGCLLFDRLLTRHITRETVEHDCPWQKEIEGAGMILIQRMLDLQEGGVQKRRIVLLSDVTEIRARDKEIRIQSAIIQEIHHRVKNNLQMMASLLRLQARRSKSQEVKDALKVSIHRIQSISVVHEFLSQQGTEDIDVQEVLHQIVGLVALDLSDKDFVVHTEYRGPRLVLPSRYASSVALVLNELLLNTMKHAFAGRKSGTIGLRVEEEPQRWCLDLYDDGVGLPADFAQRPHRSLGLQIVKTLVEGDLGGTFALQNDSRGAGYGTHALLTIAKPDGEEKPGYQAESDPL